MDHHDTDGDDVSRFFHARKCIKEHCLAESFPLLRSIHGESCEQHDADRMISEAFGDPLRALVLVYGTGGERVLTGGPVAIERYVGLRRVGLLIRPSVFLQPKVQRWIAAFELTHAGFAGQLFNDEFRLRVRHHDRRFATCGSANS